MKFENYRSNLATDLKEVRKEENGRERASSILEQEKKTIRYVESRELHIANDVLPKFETISDEELDGQAIERLNEKTLYEKKVSLLREIFMEQYEEEINEKTSAILAKVGFRNAESFTLWESVKSQLLDSVMAESGSIDDKSSHEDSMAGIRFIDKDDHTSSIEKFVSENHEHLGLEETEKLKQWLKNRSIDGEYQLYRHISPYMLDDVVSANRFLSENFDQYDPETFGITKKMIDRLVVGIACIRADFKSKPNYPYARPEMGGQLSSMYQLLSSLTQVRAQEFLKTHDIELSTD